MRETLKTSIDMSIINDVQTMRLIFTHGKDAIIITRDELNNCRVEFNFKCGTTITTPMHKDLTPSDLASYIVERNPKCKEYKKIIRDIIDRSTRIPFLDETRGLYGIRMLDLNNFIINPSEQDCLIIKVTNYPARIDLVNAHGSSKSRFNGYLTREVRRALDTLRIDHTDFVYFYEYMNELEKCVKGETYVLPTRLELLMGS